MTDQERLFLAAANAEGGMPVSAGGPPFRASEADPSLTQVRPAFDPNAPIDPAPTVAPDTLPTSVPGYEVIEVVGSGTMGVVYKARETALKRLVALKLLRGNAHPDAVARFLIEAEAVAAIDHPRVVRIYQYGEHNGRPFLAMEYLSGDTLTKRFGGRAFPPREAAVLVAKLATGVGAAHALGIVHRDLKPGNVLFDNAGEPKVADFGLARRGAGSDQTRTDATMGTPPYMPPEQFGGAKYAGPPADVWALGVILYECLTGTRPFLGDNRDELRDRIDRGDPAPPSRVAPEVPRDLELICLKCLAKAPSDRYPTAAVLADDLNRFLDWKPVSVRTFRWSERAVLWVRRNPVVAVLLAAVVVSLVIGATVSYLNYRDARKQEGIALAKAEDAEREAREAKRQEEIAIAQRNEARRQEEIAIAQRKEAKRQEEIAITQRTLAEATRDYTLGVLDTMTSEITGDSLATQKAITLEQKKFLTEVLTSYKKFAGEKGDDELSRKRTAVSAYRVGLIEYRLGRKEESVAAFRLARDGFVTLVADFPTVPHYRADLARSHGNLGVLFHGLRKWMEAEQECRQALAIQAKLAADFPAVPHYRADLAHSHSNLGVVLNALGKWSKVEPECRQALAIQAKLVADFPKVSEYRANLAVSHNNLGGLLQGRQKWAEAEEEYRQALAIQAKLATDFPTAPVYRAGLARSHSNLGLLLKGIEKPIESGQECRQALAIWGKLTTDFPAVPEYQADLAASHLNLGSLLEGLRKWTEAAEEYRQALAIFEKLAVDFPEYRADLAKNHFSLGVLLANARQWSDAEKEYRKAMVMFEKLAADFPAVPDYRAGLARSHLKLGNLLKGIEKPIESGQEYRKALAIWGKLTTDFPAVPEYRADLAASHLNLGTLLKGFRKWPEAAEEYRQGLAIFDKLAADFPAVPEYRDDLAWSHLNLGTLLKGLGQWTEAAKEYREALAIFEKLVADFPNVPEYRQEVLARSYNLASLCALASGKVEDKKQEYADQAMELLQKAVKAGYIDASHMAKDTDLDPLRDRDDFKKLLESLSKPKAKEKGPSPRAIAPPPRLVTR